MNQPMTTALAPVPAAGAPLALTGPGELGGFEHWLVPERFDHVQRIARVFAESGLVPPHFRGKVPDCIVAIQLALRLRIDPFLILQNIFIINGRPGLEAKLVIALVNERGPFSGPIQWRFSGAPNTEDWSCTAFATDRRSGQLCEVTLSWATVNAEGWARREGSKWRSMAEVMFRYRTASILARLHCPEVLVGLRSADELEDAAGETIIMPAAVTAPPLAAPDAFRLPSALPRPGESTAQPAAAGEDNQRLPPRRRRATPARRSQGAPTAEPGLTVPPEPLESPEKQPPADALDDDSDDNSDSAPDEGSDDPTQKSPGRLMITCRAAPPENWIAQLRACGFINHVGDQFSWIAPVSETTTGLALEVGGEPWFKESRALPWRCL